MHLRNHVPSQPAVAAPAADPVTRAAALSFAVVGGGFAGVEALAELQGLARCAVGFYPSLNPAGLRWVLVEATGQILPELDDQLARWTLRAAAARRRRPAEHAARPGQPRHDPRDGSPPRETRHDHLHRRSDAPPALVSG